MAPAQALSAGQLKTVRNQARRYLADKKPELDKSRWDTIESARDGFLEWLDGNENKSIADTLREGDNTSVIIQILQAQAAYLRKSKN